MVYKIPLVLPHVVVGFLVILAFSRTGWLSSAAHALGLIAEPTDFPDILYGGRGLGIITAYIIKETSYAALMTGALMARMPPGRWRTARMLGASPWTAFRTVLVPAARPAIYSSFLLLFLYSLGAFDIPYILAESRPEMLSVYVFNLYFRKDLSRRPEAAAILVVLLAISLLIVRLMPPGVRRGADDEA